MTSTAFSNEDPDWMYKPLGISRYCDTGINDNYGDGDDD